MGNRVLKKWFGILATCDIKYFSVIEIFDKKVINQAEYHIFYHTNNQYKNVISSKSTTWKAKK